jgi:hypothetical protein
MPPDAPADTVTMIEMKVGTVRTAHTCYCSRTCRSCKHSKYADATLNYTKNIQLKCTFTLTRVGSMAGAARGCLPSLLARSKWWWWDSKVILLRANSSARGRPQPPPRLGASAVSLYGPAEAQLAGRTVAGRFLTTKQRIDALSSTKLVSLVSRSHLGRARLFLRP